MEYEIVLITHENEKLIFHYRALKKPTYNFNILQLILKVKYFWFEKYRVLSIKYNISENIITVTFIAFNI